MPPRLSQRPSLACRECTKGKRKCNKKIPCERCTRLGLSCEREAVYLKSSFRRNNNEIVYLEDLRNFLESSCDIKAALENIEARISYLRFGSINQSSSSYTPNPSPAAVNYSLRKLSPVIDTIIDPSTNESLQKRDLTVTSFEHMAWGREHNGCFPHRHCECRYRQLSTVSTSPTAKSDPEYITATSAVLPDRALAKSLVSFHVEHIAWHHNAIHCESFLQQCQMYWETGRYEHPQWIALYCSILSVSLMCLQNSWKYHGIYPIALTEHSPLALFHTMVDVLYSSNFLGDITLYSIQAIVISTEVAHNLGLSQLNATLFNAAIKMAECLGLHKIGEDGLNHGTDIEQDGLEREIGRRIWLQMVIQDHFAIPFTDSYGIHPSGYSTSTPKNANNATWEAVPDEIPTTSTYNRVLGKIAQLMPELFDGLGSLREPKTLREQYRHVVHIDTKMRQIVRDFPHFLLQQDAILEEHHPWLSCARQSLAITAAEKIIMIHRPFILQSFQTPVYIGTRRTCTAAAVTILREHKNICDSGELSLWTHIAFCITAAVIMSFAVTCNQETEEIYELQTYIDLVRSARRQLCHRVNDTLAQRGIVLLDAIFAAAGCIEPITDTTGIPELSPISFNEIIIRFTTDLGALGLGTQSVQGEIPGLQMDWVTQENDFEDFSDWFGATFQQMY